MDEENKDETTIGFKIPSDEEIDKQLTEEEEVKHQKKIILLYIIAIIVMGASMFALGYMYGTNNANSFYEEYLKGCICNGLGWFAGSTTC